MFARSRYLMVFAGIALAACVTPSTEAKDSAADEIVARSGAERDPASERLDRLFDDAKPEEMNLARVLSSDMVGQSFSVPEANIPWSDTWMPRASGGLDWAWGNEASPLDRVLSLLGAPDAVKKNAKAWNHRYRGAGIGQAASAHGACDSVAAASERHAHLRARPVSVRIDAGKLVRCEAGQPGCVAFRVGDIDMLDAEVHADAPLRWIGNQCGVPFANLKFEGPTVTAAQPVAGGGEEFRGCKGVNPAVLLAALTRRVKLEGRPLGVMVQNPAIGKNSDIKWNHVAYKYKVNEFRLIPERTAIDLVWPRSYLTLGAADRYVWNVAAHGFAYVDFTVSVVAHRNEPRTASFPAPNEEFTEEVNLRAVLELDRAGNVAAPRTDDFFQGGDPGPAPRLLGGEFVNDVGLDANGQIVVYAPLAVNAQVLVRDAAGNTFYQQQQRATTNEERMTAARQLRLRTIPMIFTATGPSPEPTQPDNAALDALPGVGNGFSSPRHNPYVSTALVEDLVQLASGKTR